MVKRCSKLPAQRPDLSSVAAIDRGNYRSASGKLSEEHCGSWRAFFKTVICQRTCAFHVHIPVTGWLLDFAELS
jgi:hypothetical protein